MVPYVRKYSKKAKSVNREPTEEETSSLHLKNTMRVMMEEMLAQKKTQEEQPISQPTKVKQDTEQKVMQKLSRFKKFAPPPFSEAKTPMEAKDWLDKLKKILDLLQSEDRDIIMFVEFL